MRLCRETDCEVKVTLFSHTYMKLTTLPSLLTFVLCQELYMKLPQCKSLAAFHINHTLKDKSDQSFSVKNRPKCCFF